MEHGDSSAGLPSGPRPGHRVLAATAWVFVAVGTVMLFNPPYTAPVWGAPGATGMWAIGAVVVGQLVVRNRPASRVGQRLLVAAVLMAAVFAASEAVPETWTTPAWRALAGTTASWLWAPGVAAMAVAVLRFPDGELPSPRWRLLEPTLWIVTATFGLATMVGPTAPGVVGAPNPLAIDGLGDALHPLGVEGVALYVPLQLGLALCFAAPFAHHRRAQGVARRQLRLLATAGLLLSTTIFTAEMLSILLLPDLTMAPWVTSLAVILIPVAMGFAILRHRMFDADRLFSRTVSYLAITVVLAGTYAGSVVLLQLILRPVAADSDLAVATSTLAVAALFGPLRRRVQTSVDRRFNRETIDTRRALETYGQRLRDEVDLEALRSDLQQTVASTIEPTSVSLWLPPSPDSP